jgi:hypothetical protein
MDIFSTLINFLNDGVVHISMLEKDKKRLEALRTKEKTASLSYTEKMELQLLEDIEEREAEGGTTDEGYEVHGERKEPAEKVPEKPAEQLEEFELLPPEEKKVPEPVAKEAPPEKVVGEKKEAGVKPDDEKVKLAVAFGAGAIAGYALTKITDEKKEKDED